MSNLQQNSVSVFDYTDYRKYLSDYYNFQKKKSQAFSYRYFAQRAGVTSSGLYKEIIDHKRGLSRSLIVKFSEALKHNKREMEYFESMVLFGDAKTIEERKLYFTRMMAAHDSKAYKLHADQYEYFSEWYFVAIRELLAYYPFKGDYAALANALNPAIRPDQAKKAIAVLCKLGFVQKDKSGFYTRKDPIITTGYPEEDPAVKLVSLVNFQKAMHKLAEQPLNRIGNDNKNRLALKNLDMSCLTLSISHETFKTMKSEIASFRKKLLSMAEKDENPDRLYQVNYQFFPLTNVKNEDCA
jgi:uncharacterized protein (TIGR02147 family)